jgi:hypothetical protein
MRQALLLSIRGDNAPLEFGCVHERLGRCFAALPESDLIHYVSIFFVVSSFANDE